MIATKHVCLPPTRSRIGSLLIEHAKTKSQKRHAGLKLDTHDGAVGFYEQHTQEEENKKIVFLRVDFAKASIGLGTGMMIKMMMVQAKKEANV